MNRASDLLTPNGVLFQSGHNAPSVNLLYGGQFGHSPVYEEYLGTQQYIQQQLIPILLAAPTGFDSLPGKDSLYKILKSLVELHPMRISGLNAGMEMETVTTPFGGGGQVMETPTNVKWQESNIQFSWNEKAGMPVHRFLSMWWRYLIMDPDSKSASINTLPGVQVTDMLPDRYAMTMMFIEPDVTKSYVMKAWLVSNMFPKGPLENEGRMDKNAAGEQKDYDVPFSGIVQMGLGVEKVAQSILSAMSLTNADPHRRAAMMQGVNADVAALTKGYASSISDLAAASVKL